MYEQEEITFKAPNLFDNYDFLTIEEALVDYYLRNKQFEAAEVLSPQNGRRLIFEECSLMKDDILNGRFERPARWA